MTRNLGAMAALTVRNIDVERLPALLLIMKMRSSTEIFTAVHGEFIINKKIYVWKYRATPQIKLIGAEAVVQISICSD